MAELSNELSRGIPLASALSKTSAAPSMSPSSAAAAMRAEARTMSRPQTSNASAQTSRTRADFPSLPKIRMAWVYTGRLITPHFSRHWSKRSAPALYSWHLTAACRAALKTGAASPAYGVRAFRTEDHSLFSPALEIAVTKRFSLLLNSKSPSPLAFFRSASPDCSRNSAEVFCRNLAKTIPCPCPKGWSTKPNSSSSGNNEPSRLDVISREGWFIQLSQPFWKTNMWLWQLNGMMLTAWPKMESVTNGVWATCCWKTEPAIPWNIKLGIHLLHVYILSTVYKCACDVQWTDFVVNLPQDFHLW